MKHEPRTIGTIPTLNVIRDNASAVKGLFPIEEHPAFALLGRFKLSRLAGRGKRGRDDPREGPRNEEAPPTGGGANQRSGRNLALDGG